ncbi:MAG: ComF family protein [Ignavibacteriaceae bacterium]
MNFLTDIADFFLPRFCASCSTKLITREDVVCSICLNKLNRVNKSRIAIQYLRKFRETAIISDFYALYLFEKEKEVQRIIYQLKYNNKFLIGKFLGENLGRAISEVIQPWQIDMIIPVPLHHLKKAERGYNQSFYITKGLNNILHIPVNQRIIKRKRFTQSQTSLDMKEREQNIKDAFALKRDYKLKGKNILLVDDVVTTGATVRECGRLLLNNGANKIFVAAVAIAD